MGKAASTLGKRAVKPLKEFNLEQRAFKQITKEKRPAAPRHESTAHLIEETIRGQSSESKKMLTEKDDQLLQRLRSVYVTSEDVAPPEPIKTQPQRPLPKDRSLVADPEYGYFEPKNIPYGKATLRDLVHMISKHQEDPELWTAKKLSLEYRIDTGLTEKLLYHFRTFVLIMPEDIENAKVTASTLKTIPFVAPESLKSLSGLKGSKDDLIGIDAGTTVKS